MRELSLEEIHVHALGCLLYFDEVCHRHGLRYSLAHGSLLGAIRHKGFIPWDDDVDVVMLRKDFEKLEELFFSGEEVSDLYGLMSIKNNSQYHYFIDRIVDKRTHLCFMSEEGEVDDMGVFLDIYPVDYVPESWVARKGIDLWMRILISGLYAATCKHLEYKADTRWKMMAKRLLLPLMRLVKKEHYCYLHNFLLRRLPSEGDRVDDLWDRRYLKEKLFEARWFEDIVRYKFEGCDICGFKDADAFLRNQFGDYMVVKSKSGKKPRHHYKAYLVDYSCE